MKTINWSGYEWITQQRWGQIHPVFPHSWYDESCVEILSDETLSLSAKYNPKYFKEINKISYLGRGLISCTQPFTNGIFKITAKQPIGRNIGAAFWMGGWGSWPPEIDVFESETSPKKTGYFKFDWKNIFGFWNIGSNIHYLDEFSKHTYTNGKPKWMGLKNPTKHFIEYKLEWYKDIMNFYYNGYLTKQITDKHILFQLNNTQMNLILNYSIWDPNHKSSDFQTPFLIKNFEYTPLQ